MDLLICVACGQQYSASDPEDINNECFICLDDRQFVPEGGQAWTTLQTMRESGKYHNVIQETLQEKLWSIATTPKFGIGQRAIFVQEGNVLWDCISYLDAATVDFLNSKGGLKAICISHPHYYATSIEWAKQFGCKVWIFADDANWITRTSELYQMLRPVDNDALHHEVRITEDLSMVKIGGHFDGSAVLHSISGRYVLVGDTISLTPGNRRITIMYSYPNMIPLPVKTISKVCWPRLAVLDYEAIYGKFLGEQLLQSAKDATKESLELYCRKLGGSL